MSAERDMFEREAIPRFREYLRDGSVILDVGKSNDELSEHYKAMFPGMRYVTADIEPLKHPDIVDDLEHTAIFPGSFDGVICFGVWEMCDGNPFDLYAGLMTVLKDDGYFLFGIKLTGFPVEPMYDWVRFTPNGVRRLLRDRTILTEIITQREGIPSYFFAVGRK